MENRFKFLLGLHQHPIISFVRLPSNPVIASEGNTFFFPLKQKFRIRTTSTSHQMLILTYIQRGETNFSDIPPFAIFSVKFAICFKLSYSTKQFVTRNMNMTWLKQEQLQKDESVLIGSTGQVLDMFITPLTLKRSLQATWRASQTSSIKSCTFVHPTLNKLVQAANIQAHMLK